METELNMFLTIVVVLLSVMVTVVCALLFFGGSEILETLKKLNANMEKIALDNDEDHKAMIKRIEQNEDDILVVKTKVDSHIESHR